MRVLLKKDDFYSNIYKVTRSNSICVITCKKLWESGLDAYFTKLDAHFTYPPDGNFHISIKHKHEDRNRFQNIYYNNIKTKEIFSDGSVNNSITHRHNNEGPPNFFVPQVILPPFSEYEKRTLYYSFPTLGSSISNQDGYLVRHSTFKQITPRGEDIVIDLDYSENFYFNINCYLSGLDGKLANIPADSSAYRLDNNSFPHINLLVSLSKR